MGSNPAGGMDVCLFRVLCEVEVSATGRSLVQRSPECGVSESDHESSIMRPWPIRGYWTTVKKKKLAVAYINHRLAKC